MELPGHTLSTSDPVQQDSLKDWRLKTSPLKKKKNPQRPNWLPSGKSFFHAYLEGLWCFQLWVQAYGDNGDSNRLRTLANIY